jgi:putative ATP-binding cassette transporter
VTQDASTPPPRRLSLPAVASVLGLLGDEDPRVRRRIVLGAAVCGLANAGLLAVINAASASKGGEAPGMRMFLLFLLLMAIYYVAYRYTFHRTTEVFQSALHKAKLRVADKLRLAHYGELEKMGASEIFDRISESLTVISDSATTLVTCLQSAVLVAFVALYMASISMVAFGLTFALIAAGLSVYLFNSRQVRANLREAADTRLRFFDGITDLLRGAKEVKFSRQRSDDLFGDIEGIAGRLRESTERAHRMLDDNALFAQTNFFMLLGAVVFVAPQFQLIQSQSTASLVAGIIFLMGPLSSVILGIPVVTRANLAAEAIGELESRLDAAGPEEAGLRQEDPWGEQPGALEARGLVYRYHPSGPEAGESAAESFQIGPLDLAIAPGEVVFIVGGNGSGKSTLLKVLTGLYPPAAGQVLLGGIELTAQNAQAFRERFAVIFGDFHLFRRLYGLRAADERRARDLLQRMHLARKTALQDGRFSTLDLSTGQRKRLAMVVALLEERPIYAFDEWAADQDPDFRRWFYTELVPELKARGRTVVVVTHDDQYFRCADRVVAMEYGQIRSLQAPDASA